MGGDVIEPEFWLDEEDGTIWTMGADDPQECDNEEVVAELNKLSVEVERLQGELIRTALGQPAVEANRKLVGELDSLRNFFGDMTIKMPVGRAIGEIERLRKIIQQQNHDSVNESTYHDTRSAGPYNERS